MTTVTVFWGADGRLAGFRTQGHAGQAPHGSDIVCSAISALTQTAVNALESVAEVPVRPAVADGLLEVMLPRDLSKAQRDTGDIILRTIVQGLTDIASSYPAYARVVYKEWRNPS